MSDPYEDISPIKAKIMRVYHTITLPIVNSKFWFRVYYRHTKKWKKQVADVERRALEFRDWCDAEDLKNGIKPGE